MQTIGERITLVIRESGMNKTRFAERLHLSQQFISGICSGAKQPSDRTITDICREFNVNELWLRTGEGEMFRKLDKMDELMEAVGRFFANETNEFRLRFVSAAIHFTDAQWQALEAYCKLLLGENVPGSPPLASEENSSTTDAGNP